MKKLLYFQIALFFAGFATAQIPNGYYNTATGTGYALKTQLHQIVKNGHRDNGYNALLDAYKVGDLDKYYENDNTILDIYSEKPNGQDAYNWIPGQKECGNYNGEGVCYNREHVFPQGFFNENAPMKSDYLHIFPTDGYVNGKRSNYPFGTVGTASWTSTNGSKLGTSNFPGYNGTVFEPINEFKGDIARSLLYFITRYQDRLASFKHTDANNPQDGSSDRGFDQWYINLLLQWHQNDPVSQKEIDRNNYAYTYQGNRNPYIDHPEYVTMIWTSTLATGETEVKTGGLQVFPNPVKNGEISVKGENLNEVAQVQIFDLTGKLVQSVSQPFKNTSKISLQNLPKGVYILKAGSSSTKFIVQ